MNNRNKIILSSTHLDSQGHIMTKEALESMLPQLNGKRKPRLGLEHIRTFPPSGVIMNGEIIKGQDNHYYLTAESVYFDKQEVIILEDGTELVKESFSDGIFPFIECEVEENPELEISTDPSNYQNFSDVDEINKIVAEQSGLEFEKSEVCRKSELTDPETIISIGKTLAIALGILKTKIPEKIGEAIGEDLVKFYKLISSLAIETIKRTIPSNRPKNFVIFYPDNECSIELVITTHQADRVLNALTKDKLDGIENKIEQLKFLNPEKMQFIYNKEDCWEFNYLLSKEGEVIGIEKPFRKRNELFQQILEKQNPVE